MILEQNKKNSIGDTDNHHSIGDTDNHHGANNLQMILLRGQKNYKHLYLIRRCVVFKFRLSLIIDKECS